MGAVYRDFSRRRLLRPRPARQALAEGHADFQLLRDSAQFVVTPCVPVQRKTVPVAVVCDAHEACV
jgi:hypothetical protein